MDFLIGFDDEQALDAKIGGQKFCSLAKAFRAGFAVPQALAISTRAHQYFLTNNSWPDGLADGAYSAASALEISRGLSIRSSATREDLEKQSFAGQYRSFLQIVDKKDLKQNIETCWRSVSSDAVQSYLRAKKPAGYQIKTPLMGVVIQKMVNAIAQESPSAAIPCNRLATKSLLRPWRDWLKIWSADGPHLTGQWSMRMGW
jgi:pyruvate,water dikinase